MQVEETCLTHICNMVTHMQTWVEPASKVFDLVARFYLGATYFNIHGLQFIKLLASSNNNEFFFIGFMES